MSTIESPGKRAFRFGLPRGIQFSLIWTLFFAIIGIFIQYSKQASSFVWYNFFTSNFLEWFSSFGHFTDPTLYADLQSVIFSILGSWYYFFYTGGLLALIWGIISWIIHLDSTSSKKEIFNIPSQEQIKQDNLSFSHSVDKEDIEDWLDEAWLLISEGKVQEAESMYNQIRRYYNPSKDPEKFLHASIIDLYLALLECKK
jgi:hypothetical protein